MPSLTLPGGSAPAAAQAPQDQSLLLPGQWQDTAPQAGGFLVPVGTSWVSNDVLRVSEEIAHRWPNLRVASCGCNRCLELGHYPHVVVELTRDGRTVPVFGFTEFSAHIIERLHAIHASQNPNEAAMKHNEMMRHEMKRRQNEAAAEKLEVVEAALKSPKTTWRGPKAPA